MSERTALCEFCLLPWQSNLPKGWTLKFTCSAWVTPEDVERWRRGI